MDMGIIGTVITFLLTLGGTLAVVKKYYMPVKEVGELILSVSNALKDGKITKEELETIIKEYRDMKTAIIVLKSK